MYKKIFTFVLMVAVFSSSALPVFAAGDVEDLTKQLSAIEQYLERLTQQKGRSNPKALSSESMRDIIKDGVNWLVEAQEPNGHFAYEFLPYENEYRKDDNIVRQAGALFALSEVARREETQNTKADAAIKQAIAFFENQSAEDTYEGKKMRCVTNTQKSSVCKLGATALALTGVLGYVEARPEKKDVYEDLIEEFTSYILASKKKDAGFRNEYKVGEGFRSEAESSFSNGEALLALVRYYQYSPNKDVKKVIDETFIYLKGTQSDTALYLWIMAALKDMQILWPNEAYVEYGKKFTSWRLGPLASSHGTVRNYCAAAEGLVSAYSLLEGSATQLERTKLRSEIDLWNVKNAGLQIGSEDTFRLVDENGKLSFKEVKNIQQSEGGFLTADTELTQRIDFTQHCISTYLQTLVDIDGKKI